MSYQSSTPRVYKRKLHIVLDAETGSTSKQAAVYDIGAVTVDYNDPENSGVTFNVKIKPSEYKLSSQFKQDHATAQFHENQNPGYLDTCEAEGVTIAEAVDKLQNWILVFADQGYEIHMWSQGKDFDFPILDHLFEQCLIKSPWAYSRVHCLRDLVWLNPGARLKEAQTGGKHQALPDALYEAKQLVAVVNASSWYQRLFK